MQVAGRAGGGSTRRPAPIQRLQRVLGNRRVLQLLAGLGETLKAREPEGMIGTALAGTRTPSRPYPHAEAIGRSFGRHAIAGLQAHLGPAASASASAIDAEAYAVGDHVVFSRAPDLRTAAHEAAHVIQQRAGVSLPGGVGRVGDAYERHADAVAARVQSGGSAEGLLDRVAAAGRGAAGGDAVVQRLIRYDYTTWLGAKPPSKALIEAYFSDFLMPEYRLALRSAKGEGSQKIVDDEQKGGLSTAYSNVVAQVHASKKTGVWTNCTAVVDTLVTEINKVLGNYTTWGEDLGSYSNREKRGGNWKTDPTKEALQKLEGLVIASGLGVKTAQLQPTKQTAGQPDIPGIKWSLARPVLPPSLFNLIRDIYASWHIGVVLDERGVEEQRTLEKNPKEPATLRSWHMNEQGQLPSISGGQIPQGANALHEHYKRTGQHPYNKEIKTGPIGYAEYTGTGLLNDAHNSKIVLDYKSGLIYLTVTHYQLYDRTDDKEPVYTQKNKTAGSGARSAWFYFDMTQ